MGNIYHTVDENASFLAVFFTAFFSLLNSSRSETEAIPREVAIYRNPP
jgi:hypothetical protein